MRFGQEASGLKAESCKGLTVIDPEGIDRLFAELAKTTTPTDVSGMVPLVLPGVPRSEMEAASSAFVDAVGESVSLITRYGDYVVVDAASGLAVWVYDARALRLGVRTDVVRDGRLDWDSGRRTAVQALVAAGMEEGTAEFIEVGGRPAAQVTYRIDYWFDEHIVEDHVVAVDLETGLIVRDAVEVLSPEADPGDPTPAVDGPVTTGLKAMEADFAVPDGGLRYFDDGYRLVGSVAEAEALAGYEIPVPGWLPDGFVLTQVAFGENPGGVPGPNVVVLTYRKWAWRIDVVSWDLSGGRYPIDPFDREGMGRILGAASRSWPPTASTAPRQRTPGDLSATGR